MEKPLYVAHASPILTAKKALPIVLIMSVNFLAFGILMPEAGTHKNLVFVTMVILDIAIIAPLLATFQGDTYEIYEDRIRIVSSKGREKKTVMLNEFHDYYEVVSKRAFDTTYWFITLYGNSIKLKIAIYYLNPDEYQKLKEAILSQMHH